MEDPVNIKNEVLYCTDVSINTSAVEEIYPIIEKCEKFCSRLMQ